MVSAGAPAPGDVLAGKYRVERVLGEGGMGVVVAAHHLALDERVAIKLLLPEVASTPTVVERFVREARALAKIKSEHVARVSDVATLEGGMPYMVMEYLEGTDLEAMLQTRGALALDDAIDFTLQALEAIAEAHTLGIVHRDVKPANLFVTRRRDGSSCVKVLDFGISKMAGSATATAAGAADGSSKTQGTLGTPLYMPPEQWAAARTADARSDIWSIGAVLFHLVAGRPPFLGETVPEIFTAVTTGSPPLLRSLRPDAPDGLENVILRCLEKEPERRFRNVAALAGALGPYASRRGRQSIERISAVFGEAGLSVSGAAQSYTEPPVRAQGATTEAAWGRTRDGNASGAWLAFSIAGGILLVGTAAVLLRAWTSPTTNAALAETAEVAPAAPGPGPAPATPATTATVAATPPAVPTPTASLAASAHPAPPPHPGPRPPSTAPKPKPAVDRTANPF